MTARQTAILTLSLACCFLSLPARSQDLGNRASAQKQPENVQKAQAQVDEHLKKLGGPGAQVLWLGQEPVRKVFPNHLLFAARYRQFPVARALPEGLRASNIFVVPGDGKLLHVKDIKELQAFFNKNLGAVKEEKAAQEAVKAWLHIAQEYHQDGMFKFSIFEEATKVADKDGGKEATGKAVVMQGGNGEIVVTLGFDAEGKLSRATEAAKIRAGPRPICQATKLLDPDPVVRRMAEQDLLIMGLAARDYLMEQRDRSGPELRRAIDGIWRKIVEAGW